MYILWLQLTVYVNFQKTYSLTNRSRTSYYLHFRDIYISIIIRITNCFLLFYTVWESTRVCFQSSFHTTSTRFAQNELGIPVELGSSLFLHTPIHFYKESLCLKVCGFNFLSSSVHTKRVWDINED